MLCTFNEGNFLSFICLRHRKLEKIKKTIIQSLDSDQISLSNFCLEETHISVTKCFNLARSQITPFLKGLQEVCRQAWSYRKLRFMVRFPELRVFESQDKQWVFLVQIVEFGESLEDFYNALSDFLINNFALEDSVYTRIAPHFSLAKAKNTPANAVFFEQLAVWISKQESMTKALKVSALHVKIGHREHEIQLS